MGFSNWPWNASNAIDGRYESVQECCYSVAKLNWVFFSQLFNRMIIFLTAVSSRSSKTETNFCAELKHFSHGWCFNMHKNVENFKSLFHFFKHQGLSTSLLLKMPSKQGMGGWIESSICKKTESFKKPIKKLTPKLFSSVAAKAAAAFGLCGIRVECKDSSFHNSRIVELNKAKLRYYNRGLDFCALRGCEQLSQKVQNLDYPGYKVY